MGVASDSERRIDGALSLVREVRRDFERREADQNIRLQAAALNAAKDGVPTKVYADDPYERLVWLRELRTGLECAETSLQAFLRKVKEA